MEISIIIASRGDSYGGDNLKKTLRLTRRIAHVFTKYQIAYEILVVDYNPVPSNRFRMFSGWPKKVRIIEVPLDSIQSINGTNKPFVEFHAKNIGIRRATGKQVLCINNDIKISVKALLACVSRPHLDKSFLRLDRLDITYPNEGLIPRLLLQVRHEDNIKPISLDLKKLSGLRARYPIILDGEREEGNFIVSPTGGTKNHVVHGLHTNASGDFLCAPSELWSIVNGYSEQRYQFFMGDALILAAFLSTGYRQLIMKGPFNALHINHSKQINHREGWSEESNTEFMKYFNQICHSNFAKLNKSEDWGLGETHLKEFHY